MTGNARRGGGSEGCDVCARERLLREAAELFSRKGYAATSVGEIVAAAGVTKPVLYYHFESKDGLYRALLEEAVGRLRPAVAASLRGDGTSAAQRIRTLCNAIVESAGANLSTVRLMRALHYAPPQDAPEIDLWEFPLTITATLERIVREGVRSGEFSPIPPGDLVWTILGLINVYVDSNLLQPDIALRLEGFRSALDLALAGAAARRTHQGGR
ncbi:MAG TPA: TetR/AcrR family transcriptional regulator [bacterium]